MSLEFKHNSLIPAIESVVTNIQSSGEPYYRYGHIKEIQNLLSKKKRDKYPLVILRLDTTANYRRENIKYTLFPNVTIYIVSWTRKNYDAEKRKEEIFDKALIPIYENFINELRKNANFNHGNMIPFVDHDMTERYFWGSELSPQTTESVLGDPLDCIELSFPELLVKNLNC